MTDDLPNEVLREIDAIFSKARKEKNFAQEMKAWVYKVKWTREQNPDSMKVVSLPEYPASPVNDAVANAIMGTDKQNQDADKYFDKVLQNLDALYAEKTEKFMPLLDYGKDSRLYGDDMLSVLTDFVCEHSNKSMYEKAELSGKVADYYRSKGNMNAWALMTMRQLDYESSFSRGRIRLSHDAYVARLKTLVEDTKDYEAGADVAEAYCASLKDNEKLLFARWAQKQYPDHEYFRYVEDEIMSPMCSMSLENVLADNPSQMRISYENIEDVHLDIRLFNGKDKDDNYLETGEIVQSRDYKLGQDNVNLDKKAQNLPTNGTEYDNITLPPGKYLFVLTGKKMKCVKDLHVTSLRLFTYDLPDMTLFVVLDNVTGRPVAGASVKIYDNKINKEIAVLTTDKNGEAYYHFDGRRQLYKVWAELGKSDKTHVIGVWSTRSDTDHKYRRTSTNVYTDRGVYRPGQTVHVGILVNKQWGDSCEVLADRHEDVTLYDCNNKVLKTESLVTNDYGSAAVDFVIPEKGEVGSYRVVCGNNSARIEVEEYKRPTFGVTSKVVSISNLSDNQYSFGDTVNVELLAMAFSGVPVHGARVEYTIRSAQVGFWDWNSRYGDEQESGELSTDDEGKIVVPLFLDKQNYDIDMDNKVRYTIDFKVTDQAGESHEENFSLYVSSCAFVLSIDANSIIDLSTDEKVTVNAVNANGDRVDYEGKYTLTNVNDDSFRYEQSFRTNASFPFPHLACGEYEMKAFAIDKNGKTIETSRTFKVFDSKDAVTPSSTSHLPSPISHQAFITARTIHSQKINRE